MKRKGGYEVTTCRNAAEAIKAAKAGPFHVAVTDVRMPGMSGMALLKDLKEIDPGLVVIVMTAFGSIDDAVKAMKRGAFDYITKPFKMDEFLVVIEKAAQERQLREEVDTLRREVHEKYEFSNIIGRSKPMQEIFALVRRIADTDTTVLIRGKTGTGKELIARAIHHNSRRGSKPFVAINCGAIPETLLESELFGHVAGAFTGAISTKKGLFEEANGGTILLDEIGEIPPSIQVKLLRVLQEKEVKRVGSTENIKVDVRVLAATSRDLEAAMRAGGFREELFYRLNVIPIVLPDLKDRKEDIPLLVDHFVQKYSREGRGAVKGISREALQLLMNYDWPGNVREVENVIERAIILAKGKEILPQDVIQSLPAASGRPEQGAKPMEELEKEHIARVLREAGGQRTKAAEVLGIDRKTLYLKIKKYGLEDL
jgi:DNA-binding NtrC family response regulator